jgi:cytoskeleton protein RodZ
VANGDVQSLGDMLRDARESQALSLEEVEAQTRIRVKFLEALETGDLDELPSQAHARGFLRNYAQYLHLDVNEVMGRFAEATGTAAPSVTRLTAQPAPYPAHEAPADLPDEDDLPHPLPVVADEPTADDEGDAVDDLTAEADVEVDAGDVPAAVSPPPTPPEAEPLPAAPSRSVYVAPEQWTGPGVPQALTRQTAAPQPVEAPQEPKQRRGVLRSPIVTGLVLIVGFVLITWAVTTKLSTVSGDQFLMAVTPTAATQVAAEAATVSPSPTFRLTSTPAPEEAVEILDRVVLSIDVTQRAWVRIDVDGEMAFEGQALPGEVLHYEGQEEVFLRTGNGGGLDVTYNGRDIGPLGERGEIVERFFLVAGEATPTTTPTPTPTITGVPTATPRPTFTPTP